MKWKTEKQYNRENQWNLSWFAEKTKQNSKIGVPKTRRRKNIEKASYQVRNEKEIPFLDSIHIEIIEILLITLC